MRLTTRITSWVVAPMVILSFVAAVSLWLADLQYTALQTQQTTLIADNIAKGEKSRALSEAYVDLTRAMTEMENKRRANIGASAYSGATEVRLREAFTQAVDTYQASVVSFLEYLSASGLEDDGLNTTVSAINGSTGEIQNQVNAYIASNVKTLELAEQNSFLEARDSFRFDELLRLQFLRNSLNQLNVMMSGLSDHATKMRSEAITAQIERSKQKHAHQMRLSYVIGIAVVVTVAVAALISVSRGIVRPIRSIPDRVRQTGQNGSAATEDTQRKDEIGDILSAVADFGKRLEDEQQQQKRADEQRFAEQNRAVQAIGLGLSKLSQGDLSARVSHPLPQGYEELRTDFNKAMEKIQATVVAVMTATDSLFEGLQGLDQSSTELSQRTEGQAATLEQTAAALEEMTASVRATAENARDVENNMEGAQQEATASNTVVQNAVGAMSNIQESSGKISRIIGVIDDIAFQTNLLALNAGVEAARAGEAGRGFAVVASEVRSLAQRSSDAALEIKALIADSTQQVQQGVDLVDRAGQAITAISSRVNEISELMSGITSAASEQATGLGEINVGVSQLDNVTQRNAAMVEETTASVQLMASDAANLKDIVSFFDIDGRKSGQHADDGLAA